MGSLLSISRVSRGIGAFAKEASVGKEVIALSEGAANVGKQVIAVSEQAANVGKKVIAVSVNDEQNARMIKSLDLPDDEQNAMTIKPFFILVVSLFFVAFLVFLIARRSNPRLMNNGNIQGEQPDEEQQMLVGNSSEANPGTDHHDQEHRKHCLSTLQTKLNFGTPLALLNFILEIPSAVFDQIASDKKPAYVLVVMLFSFASMLVCLVELVYYGRKRRITWKWTRGKLPWFYHPPPLNNKPFGTLIETVGLVCAIAQCIISTINYSFCRRDHAAPIKICVWPTIFSFGLLCSRFMGKPKEDGGESRTSDQDGGDVTLAELQQ